MMESKNIKIGSTTVTVTVTRPKLTDKERALREAQILTAAGNLLRSAAEGRESA